MPKINRITKKDGKITKSQVDAPTPVYNVRIKPELYEPIVILSQREGRSVTAQVNYMLQKAMPEEIQDDISKNGHGFRHKWPKNQ